MSGMTPFHPLTEKLSLTRDEWMELLDHEGLVGVTEEDPDIELLRDMEAEGLIGIEPMGFGTYLGVCPREKEST